jgi:hypothetical protein
MGRARRPDPYSPIKLRDTLSWIVVSYAWGTHRVWTVHLNHTKHDYDFKPFQIKKTRSIREKISINSFDHLRYKKKQLNVFLALVDKLFVRKQADPSEKKKRSPIEALFNKRSKTLSQQTWCPDVHPIASWTLLRPGDHLKVTQDVSNVIYQQRCSHGVTRASSNIASPGQKSTSRSTTSATSTCLNQTKNDHFMTN